MLPLTQVILACVCRIVAAAAAAALLQPCAACQSRGGHLQPAPLAVPRRLPCERGQCKLLPTQQFNLLHGELDLYILE